MIHPYVGISGAGNINESRLLRKAFSDSGYTTYCPTTSHQPMIGILISNNTLNGEKIKNGRYPKMNKLIKMLRHASGNYPMIHYYSRELDTLADQIEKVFDYIYEYNVCRALQLNISYPPLDQMIKIKEKMPEMEIVFAATKGVLEGRSPSEIAKSIIPYKKLINYVLIDPSGGRGEEFDLNKSSQIFFEIKEKMPHLLLGFAGGFNSRNVEKRVKSLIDMVKTSEFCIDVEGGVRDITGLQYGFDSINFEEVNMFLKNAHRVLP